MGHNIKLLETKVIYLYAWKQVSFYLEHITSRKVRKQKLVFTASTYSFG